MGGTGHARLTSYTVSYDSESHWSVLTQMQGSLWPKVLPYCLFNAALMVVLIILDHHFSIKVVHLSTQGHSFISLVVAFLLVSRVNLALTRFGTARDGIGTMYREARELVQTACVLSDTLHDDAAKEWRHEIAYRSALLLKVAMAIIDYPIDKVEPWKLPELNGMEAQAIQSLVNNPTNRRWVHEERSVWEEAMRVPIHLAYMLRQTIHSQNSRLQTPIQVNLENKLLAYVDSYMNGYFGIQKFLTTPVPFPLIQMARTFLFLYVFTVPFVMLSDTSSDAAHVFAVFLLTYGFMGLEMVAIELDNPFGDDPNDFNNAAMAVVAFEDIYLTILSIDGPEWTDKLRVRMYDRNNKESLPTEQTWLLEKIV